MKARPLSKAFSAMLAGILFAGALPLETFAETTASVKPVIGRTMQTVLREKIQEEDPTALKNGDVNADGKIDEADATAVLTAKLADAPQAVVNADGVLDQTDSDMISSFVSGEIGYFPVGTYYNASAGFITRGAWIHALAEGFSMHVDDESSMVAYFTDLADCAYKKDIDLAANFGVFDILEEEFHPDEYVTRDFAAHTMNFCLGYPNDVTVTFTDTDEVFYDGDAQIALNQGWFTAVNDEFRPSMYMTAAESELAYAAMKAAVESAEIDENHEDQVKLNSAVKQITDAEKIEMSGDTFTITGSKAEIAEGDTISFTYEGLELVRKVTTVSQKDGVYTLTTEDPEDEMVEETIAEGYAVVDYSAVEILTEGVTVDIEESEEPVRSRPGVSLDKEGTAKIDKTFKLGGTFDVAGTPLTLKGTIKNIRVPYSVDTTFVIVNYFYLGVDADVDIEASINGKSEISPFMTPFGAREIPLMSMPVIGASSFGVNLVISAQFSVSGKLQLVYSFTCGGSVEYKRGRGWRVDKSFQQKQFSAEASAEEKLGAKIELNAKIGKKKIGTVYASAGEFGRVSLGGNSQNMDLTCLDVRLYIYMEIGANLNILNLIKFDKTWTIFDEDNSPVKVQMHWDNGVRVDKCTAGNAPPKKSSAKVTGKGGSSSGKKSGGYVKGTGYTSGYTKTASAGKNNNESTGFIPVYYKSTVKYKELEPPTVISEDMVLTADTTYHTDLEFTKGATLDLNGHKLTVEGNITFTNGCIYVNGGSLDAKKNVYLNNGGDNSRSQIKMDNKADYALIEGDLEIWKYQGTSAKTAGTMEIRGNIKGNTELGSTDMHTVVLGGTNDITLDISTGNSNMFNMLEIKNSDKRKITVDKYFKVNQSTVCDGASLNLICNESGNDSSVLSFPKLTVDELNIKGDFQLNELNLVGSKFNVTGSIHGFKCPLTLQKGTEMNVTGSVWGNMRIYPNGSTIKIAEDLSLYSQNDYSGRLILNSKNDYVFVGKQLKLYSQYDDSNDGIIEVKGDVTFDGPARLKGYNKVILSGEEDLTIFMTGNDIANYYFNDLEIQNLDKRKVFVDGGFNVLGKTDCGDNPLNIVSRDGNIALGELTCSELNVSGDITMFGSTKLKAKKATFDGNLTLTNYNDCSVDFNGVPVTVAKTLTAGMDTNLRGAEINCTDFALTARSFTLNGGKLNVSGDMSVSGGKFVMANENDFIDIKGDLDISRRNSDDAITAGTIQCAGDISSANSGIGMKDASKFILTGEKDQILRIDLFNTGSGIYQFANLHVKNAAARKIVNKGILNCGTIAADADAITMTSEDGRLAGGKLLTDINITGDVTKRGLALDLNGHTLNIEGNLWQEAGTITPNTGKLLVSGDYMIVTEHDAAVLGVSEGVLNMVNDGDYVSVGGSFVTKAKADHTKNLTAGTMEVKGNFSQLAGGSAKAFPASGTHKVILSGDKKQNVVFENYDSSHFNILTLTQDKEQYVFSDDPCWTELGGEEQPPQPGDKVSGDANEDGSIDLKDVTVMRRALAGGWEQTINETNADVNNDGSFDLKDVTILRRYLAGGWNVTLA